MSPLSAERWFRRVLWIGIIANITMAVPTLIAPEQMMRLSDLPVAFPLLWPRFAALLLILLSAFYMPAGIDPNRYRTVAWLAVGSRLVGFVFFVFLQSAEYHLLGYFDLVFFVPEVILLSRLPKTEPSWFVRDGSMMIGLITKRQRIVIAALFGLALVAGIFAYNRFFLAQTPPYFTSDEEHFLYGSVGTEAEQGVPYWIWLVLPRIFPDHLPGPGGYASIGVLARDGHEMPIGLSKVTVGFPRVGINCAMCHTASFRARPDDVPTIYPAAASHQTGEQEYLRFLIACASDPRFTADTILAEIARNTRLSLIDRLLYRFAIIPGTRRALLRLGETDGWMLTRPDWGRGRIDPFNPVKFTTLKQPVDSTIGNSDMVPLWNLGRRDGTSYHWDGLNTSLREVVQSSAIGDGATTDWVDRDYARWDSTDPRQLSSLRRVMNYIASVQAPTYPFPIDQTLATSGAVTYKERCAQCHEMGAARTGTVIPLAEIGTDRHRLDMWTTNAAAAYNAYGEGHAWKFSKFVKSGGYVAMPLDGVWLTGPYLHNGSVPTLTDLLEVPANRPKKFWRGYDLYDSVRVGFISDGAEAQRVGTPLDVSLAGNSNAGHTYGADLTAEQKRALLEYLKTL